MKNQILFIKKAFTLILLMLFCISCGSSKKTTTNQEKSSIEIEAKTVEKLSSDKSISNDSSLVAKKENTDNNTSNSTQTEIKTKIVLKTEKDSSGNIKPSSYKEVVNGKVKTEISINGNGEVSVETTTTNTETKNTSTSTQKDSISKKVNKKENSLVVKEKEATLTDNKETDSKLVIEKKNTSIWYRWWFWLIILLIIATILYLSKRFQLFVKLKNILVPNKNQS